MKIRPLSIAAGVLAAAAGLAQAGTPLSDPPFGAGGFVPPDSTTLKVEVSVGKIISKYVAGLAACDSKAVIALQLAYEPANMAKVPSVQSAWTACRSTALTKFMIARDKLISKGTPACLNSAAIDSIQFVLENQVLGLSIPVYCDADAAAPDPATGLNIPDAKIEAVGETLVAKTLLKAGSYVSKCLDKGVSYTFKLGGTLPPDYLAKVQACVAKAQTLADTTMLKLDQTQKLPSCMPLPVAQALGQAAVSLGGSFTGMVYCASPSGAFID